MPMSVLVVPAIHDASSSLELLNVLQSLSCFLKINLLDESFAVFLGEAGDGEHQSYSLSICLDINVQIVFWRYAQLLCFVGGRSWEGGCGFCHGLEFLSIAGYLD